MSKKIVKEWTQTKRGLRYKIRLNSEGKYDCISYNFWGIRGTYGDFETFAEAADFHYQFDRLSLTGWKQTKGKKEITVVV